MFVTEIVEVLRYKIRPIFKIKKLRAFSRSCENDFLCSEMPGAKLGLTLHAQAFLYLCRRSGIIFIVDEDLHIQACHQ